MPADVPLPIVVSGVTVLSGLSGLSWRNVRSGGKGAVTPNGAPGLNVAGAFNGMLGLYAA
jgi:hypothetical protein